MTFTTLMYRAFPFTKRYRESRRISNALLKALVTKNRCMVAAGKTSLIDDEPLFTSRVAVENAMDELDVDMLKVFERFPLEDLSDVDFTVQGMRKALGSKSVASIITPEHVAVYRRTQEAFLQACINTGKHLSPDRPGYITFELGYLVLGNMDHADELIQLIKDRNITDETTLVGLMEGLTDNYGPLRDGAL